MVKISELTALTSVASADVIPINDASAANETKKTTVGDIAEAVAADSAMTAAFIPTPTEFFVPATDFEWTTPTQGTVGYSNSAGPFMLMGDSASRTCDIMLVVPPSLGWATYAVYSWWASCTAGTGDIRVFGRRSVFPTGIVGATMAGSILQDNTTLTGFTTVGQIKEKKLDVADAAVDNTPRRFGFGRWGDDASDTLAGDVAFIGMWVRKVS